MQEVISELNRIGVTYTINTPLHTYTTWKIGGPCDLLVLPSTAEEVWSSVRLFNKAGFPWMMIGKGSNILVSDEGFRGAVIRLSGDFDSVSFNEEGILAGGGYSLITLSLQAAKKGYTGLEFAGGIPGTVGGAIRMNAGAHGSDISQILSQALILNEKGEFKWIDVKELSFDYRYSIIQDKPWIVVVALFSLPRGERSAIAEKTKLFKEKRLQTQPLKQPSCGSVFRNPLPHYAAKVIESCGLKNYQIGGAKFSELHANFIINTGNATAKDVKALIELAQQRAKQEHGIELIREVKYIE